MFIQVGPSTAARVVLGLAILALVAYFHVRDTPAAAPLPDPRVAALLDTVGSGEFDGEVEQNGGDFDYIKEVDFGDETDDDRFSRFTTISLTVVYGLSGLVIGPAVVSCISWLTGPSDTGSGGACGAAT